MGTITEIENWDATVYLLDETDPVLGGVDGPDNKAAINLANRTKYLRARMQDGALNFAVAGGTANAHTVALAPVLTARVDGMMLRYKAPAANTGPVTLADGVGTATVLGANHAALQGGEYAANGDAMVMWNSTIGGGSYILLACTGGGRQIAPATQSQHAMQLAQATGRLLRTTVYWRTGGNQVVSVDGGAFTTVGASTFTALAATTKVEIEAVGGGGGSGSTATTSGISVSGGGASGAYAKGVYTSGYSSLAITVGAGGSGGTTGGNGGNGGTTSVAALMSVPGGGGSIGNVTYSSGTTGIGVGGVPALSPSGSGVYAYGQGQRGGDGITTQGGNTLGGTGGASVYGGGGAGQGSGLTGNIGVGAGSGAGGVSIINGSTVPGAVGAAGIVIFKEYA